MGSRVWAAAAACLLVAACAEVPHRASSNSSALPGGPVQVLSFREVQARVEPVAEAQCRRANPRANCDFRIVVDDRPGMSPNAFQTLDGRGRPMLAVTSSLVALMANEDELALVLAHEASHHIAGHLARQGEHANLGAAAFGRIASREAGATADSIRQAQMIGAQVGARSFSKEIELEADRLGAVVAARAGFDPVRGAEFFRRIPDPGNRVLGTHPSNAERIAMVRQAVGQRGF